MHLDTSPNGRTPQISIPYTTIKDNRHPPTTSTANRYFTMCCVKNSNCDQSNVPYPKFPAVTAQIQPHGKNFL